MLILLNEANRTAFTHSPNSPLTAKLTIEFQYNFELRIVCNPLTLPEKGLSKYSIT